MSFADYKQWAFRFRVWQDLEDEVKKRRAADELKKMQEKGQG